MRGGCWIGFVVLVAACAERPAMRGDPARIDRCAEAWATELKAAETRKPRRPSEADEAATTAACVALVSWPECRVSRPRGPLDFVALESEACRRIACAELAFPRPRACPGWSGDGAALDRETGPELFEAIMTHELGTAGFERLIHEVTRVAGESLKRFSDRQRAEHGATDPPPVPVVHHAVRVQRDGVWLADRDGRRRFVRRCGGRLDVDGVRAVLCDFRANRPPGTTGAVGIGALPGVSAGDLYALQGAAEVLGFERVFVTRPDWLSSTFPDPGWTLRAGEAGPSSCTAPLPACTAAGPVPAAPAVPPDVAVLEVVGERGFRLEGLPITALEAELTRIAPRPVVLRVAAAVDARVVNDVLAACAAADVDVLAYE